MVTVLFVTVSKVVSIFKINIFGVQQFIKGFKMVTFCFVNINIMGKILDNYRRIS